MLKRFETYSAKVYIKYEYSILIWYFFVICSHWKCIRTKKLSINLRPNRNVLCSHSYSKLCLSKNLRLSPCSLITNYYYVKEKPRKIPAETNYRQKNEEKRKEIRKQGRLHTIISIMYYSDQVYLHYYALTFGAQIFTKKFDLVK